MFGFLPMLSALLTSLSPCGAFEKPIEQASDRYNIPSQLLSNLLWLESRCDPKAVSPKGAQGIAQLMPATAKELQVDPFNPVQAIWGAALHLSNLHTLLGSWCLTAAAYNAGSNRIRRTLHPNNWPRETRAYVFSLGFSLQECSKRSEECSK